MLPAICVPIGAVSLPAPMAAYGTAEKRLAMQSHKGC
jgi:hypothetical protein